MIRLSSNNLQTFCVLLHIVIALLPIPVHSGSCLGACNPGACLESVVIMEQNGNCSAVVQRYMCTSGAASVSCTASASFFEFDDSCTACCDLRGCNTWNDCNLPCAVGDCNISENTCDPFVTHQFYYCNSGPSMGGCTTKATTFSTWPNAFNCLSCCDLSLCGTFVPLPAGPATHVLAQRAQLPADLSYCRTVLLHQRAGQGRLCWNSISWPGMHLSVQRSRVQRNRSVRNMLWARQYQRTAVQCAMRVPSVPCVG